VHNDAMTTRRALFPAVLLACTLGLGACGGADPDDGWAGPTGSTTSPTGTGSASTDSAYGVEVPAGVELTAPGSTLAIGDSATIAWAPKQDVVGALRIKVTKVRQGAIKDFAGFTIDADTRASAPYYVDATVQNVGPTDLSGFPVPLYLVDATDLLIGANSFESTFAPCAAKPLPDGFKTDKTAKVCLVYLAPDHGTFDAVSFRPSEEFNPITWTGTVVKPTAKPTKKATKKS
jgi:hypothetical protein